jgi:integrase
MKTNQETRESPTRTRAVSSGDASNTRISAPRVFTTARQTQTVGEGSWRDANSTGLYLMVSKTGSRSWILRYADPARKNKTRDKGLGSLADVPLALARQKAKDLRALIADGKDPIEIRAAERAREAKERAEREAAKRLEAKQNVTFAQAVAKYLDARSAVWIHARARQSWLSPVKLYALPILCDIPLNDIRIEHVIEAMKAAEAAIPQRAVNQRRKRNGKASIKLVRQRIGQVIEHAAAIGDRDQNLANPGAFGPIDKAKPVKQRGKRPNFRRIKDLAQAPAEFQTVLAAFKRQPSTPLAALILAIACAIRPGDAVDLEWSNLDLDQRTLTLRPDQTKNGREHSVPLSDLAMLAIEQQMKTRRSEFVFPAQRRARDGTPADKRPYDYNAFAEASGPKGLNLKTSPHGWRSIFKGWGKTVARVDRDLIEEALAHPPEETEDAYDQDEAIEARRDVMARYARWLINDEPKTNVVNFPQKAA